MTLLLFAVSAVGYLMAGVVIARAVAPRMLAWGSDGGEDDERDELAVYGGVMLMWPLVVAGFCLYNVANFVLDVLGRIARGRR